MEDNLRYFVVAYYIFLFLLIGFAMLFVYSGAYIRMNWREYYDTDTWKQKREEAFKFHGRKCFICGTKWNLQVHHVRYWKWGYPIQGRENPKKDLAILCRRHHKRGRYTWWEIHEDRKEYLAQQS